jgi:hypothetical protein
VRTASPGIKRSRFGIVLTSMLLLPAETRSQGLAEPPLLSLPINVGARLSSTATSGVIKARRFGPTMTP